MKNNFTKISALLSFSIVMLLMMGCPPNKQTDQSGKQEPVDTLHTAVIKDSAAWRFKNLLKDYKNHFSIKLANHNDTIMYLDSVQSIAADFFDCNQSNPTLIAHELPYNEAFAYILHFQNMYKILACAEIPVAIPDAFRVIVNGNAKAKDNCGILFYLGIDNNNNFSIAYHNEANVVGAAFVLFPKTSTDYDYYRADCQNTNRTPIPDPNDLDIEITRYNNVCTFHMPPLTYTNDEINKYGWELMSQLSIVEPPIAFFHAKEIADLISQTMLLLMTRITAPAFVLLWL